LKEIKRNWNAFGERDPLWAIRTNPDKKNGGWDEGEFFASGEEDIASFLAQAAEKKLPAAFGTALDFGCGVGRLSLPLADRFADVVGVDCAPSMIERAAAYNTRPEKVRYLLNDKEDLSLFPDDSFDFIISLFVLQHMPKVLFTPYIGEFVRVLKPGGALIFQLVGECLAPDEEVRHSSRRWLASLLARLRYAVRGPAMEMHGADPAEVKVLLSAAGGRVVDVAETRHARIWMSYLYLVTK